MNYLRKNIKGIVIDPGHGGEDSGAVYKDSKEKDYNLLISKYMYNRFKELNIPVELTRDNDSTLSPTDRVDSILSKFGSSNDVIVISNHVNAGGGEGAEVIYALRNNDVLSKAILDNIGKTGQLKRKYYQRRLPSNPSKDYYFIHRNTKNTEPIIVEYGFIDNSKDNKFLKENYKELAEAVIEAICNYLGIKYTKPSWLIEDIYVVKKGDTLYGIANKFNTTVDDLLKINNLNNSELYIGQIIKLKNSDKLDSNIYVVKKGDSLYSIAKLYNVKVEDIIKENNLDTNILNIGQELIIPKQESNNNNNIYIVKKGDSLYSIAKKYNISVQKIKDINNLDSNIISIGQKLIIPRQENNIYTVKKGDSLYSIAKKYNTSVEKIKTLNNLESNLLNIGQILIVE